MKVEEFSVLSGKIMCELIFLNTGVTNQTNNNFPP